jgi:hypothetical protein
MQIVTGDVGIDFLHQLADAAERPAPNCLLGDEAEPALHLIEPTGVSGRVVDVVARPACQPGLNLGMLVGAELSATRWRSSPAGTLRSR